MDSYANWAEMRCGALIYTRVARDWREQLHEKFLQFDWLRAVVFHLNLNLPFLPTCENYKAFAGSSINK